MKPLEMLLGEPAAFFSVVRAGKFLGPVLSPSETGGLTAILAACEGWPISYTADALGTAYLETNGTMQPIKELGGPAYLARMYDIHGGRPAKARELGNLSPGDGVKYAGRGYVQLTGKRNYAKAKDELGVDFVGNPDWVLMMDHAAAIMRRGMEEGWFTGKRLKDYLPANDAASAAEFKASRRIINGQDRADDLATYCLHFQDALIAGKWGKV